MSIKIKNLLILSAFALLIPITLMAQDKQFTLHDLILEEKHTVVLFQRTDRDCNGLATYIC